MSKLFSKITRNITNNTTSTTSGIISKLTVVLCLFFTIWNFSDVNYNLIASNVKTEKNNKVYEVNNTFKTDYINLVNNYKNICIKYEKIKSELENLKSESSLLKRNNQELFEDNLSLQNTLKITANNGYKPKNFIIPPKISSRGYYRNQYQGKFKITAYAPCKEECGNNLGITSSGTPIVAGYSVAVDNKYWPMGTTFYIKGIGYVAAMDTGGMIKGRNRMDLAIFDKESVNNFGIRYMDVYLVKLGNGKVKIP